MARVLVSDKMSGKVEDILKAEGLQVDVNPGQKPDELAKVIGDYDGLVIRSATKVDAALLAHAKNLKVVGRAGSGLDNVDIGEAPRRASS
jgi:phosphoglycerate dehydrogenase-like enzyme